MQLDENGGWIGRTQRVIWMAVLLLAVFTAATVPVTLSKYAASATVSAGAGVAGWDVYFYASPSNLSTAYLNGSWREGPNTHRFCIYSNSEVAAEIEIVVRYETSDGTKLPAPVTADSPVAMRYQGAASHDGVYNLLHDFPAGSPGSNSVGVIDNYFFKYEPKSWVWLDIEPKAFAPYPSGATVSNCMRSYKVFVNAVQID